MKKIFGLTTPEVEELRASGNYFAWDVVNADRDRLGAIAELTDNTFAGLSGNFVASTMRSCSTTTTTYSA